MMKRMVAVLAAWSAACASSVAPPARAPESTPPPSTTADAAPADAPPRQLDRSAELGPIIGESPRTKVIAQDHELTYTTETERITIAGGDVGQVTIAPLDTITRTTSPDGTWAVESHGTDGLVAGSLVDGKLVKPVTISRRMEFDRFLGSSEDQRTVVLYGSISGWHLMRSRDGGKTWKDTQLSVSSRVESSRRTLDVVTSDQEWIRIDREGDVMTTVHTYADERSHTCAATNLWVQIDHRLRWFDGITDGTIDGFDAKGVSSMICAGDAVVVYTIGGLIRCTHAGCGPVQEPGDFYDLTSDGIATATQLGTIVRMTRTDRPAIDVQLDDGESLVGMAVWNDVPTLVLVSPRRRLRLATVG